MGSGGWGVHQYLSVFREFFDEAGVPVIRRGMLEYGVHVCGARGFIYADGVVQRKKIDPLFKDIVTGRNVRAYVSTTRYLTLYAGIRWLWPIRSRGMGVVSCWVGRREPCVRFSVTIPVSVVTCPKRNPEIYRECCRSIECFLALLGGLIDGDGSVSVYWRSTSKIGRQIEVATTDKWFAELVYNSIRSLLDPNVTIYVMKRSGRRDLYKIKVLKTRVIRAIEPYVYHPVKRARIALAIATHGIPSYRAKKMLERFMHLEKLWLRDHVPRCSRLCRETGYRVYAEAIEDINSFSTPTPTTQATIVVSIL